MRYTRKKKATPQTLGPKVQFRVHSVTFLTHQLHFFRFFLFRVDDVVSFFFYRGQLIFFLAESMVFCHNGRWSCNMSEERKKKRNHVRCFPDCNTIQSIPAAGSISSVLNDVNYYSVTVVCVSHCTQLRGERGGGGPKKCPEVYISCRCKVPQ